MAGDPPVCDCHGEPKMWKKDNRYNSGGFWICAVKRRAALARYQRNLYKRRAAENRCTRCGADDPIVAVCWKCLNEVEENDALALRSR